MSQRVLKNPVVKEKKWISHYNLTKHLQLLNLSQILHIILHWLLLLLPPQYWVIKIQWHGGQSNFPTHKCDHSMWYCSTTKIMELIVILKFIYASVLLKWFPFCQIDFTSSMQQFTLLHSFTIIWYYWFSSPKANNLLQ